MNTIPLFPLNTVLFPDGHLALQVFELRYLDMVRQCIAESRQFGVVALLQGSEVRKPEQAVTLAAVGTMARVDGWTAPLPALLQIECSGTARFKIVAAEQLKNGLWMAQAAPLAPDPAVPVPPELQGVARALGGAHGGPMHDDCGWVANRWCELLALDTQQKQRLLEQENPVLRLELVSDLLAAQGLLE